MNKPLISKDVMVEEYTIKQKSMKQNDDEVVHHINHKRNDNRIENLQLMTFKEHASLHMRERWEKKKGVMTYQ